MWGHVPWSPKVYLGLHDKRLFRQDTGSHAGSSAFQFMATAESYLTSAIAPRSRPDSPNEAAILSYCFRTRSRSCSSMVATDILQSAVSKYPCCSQLSCSRCITVKRQQAKLTSR